MRAALSEPLTKWGDMKLINIPIEYLKERYSFDWGVWFPMIFEQQGMEFSTVYPNGFQAERIKQGQFLDVVRTNAFKSQQTALMCNMVERGLITDDSVLFFHDLWHPGLTSLFYMRDGLGMKFRIVGLLHAGTYDRHDFLAQRGMDRWGEAQEECWFNEVDAIFVATKYHVRLLQEKRRIDSEKVYVTGFPIYPVQTPHVVKENIVVFPHRLAPEKQPHVFEKMVEELKPQMPGWQFIKTMDVCKSKDDYYALLARAKVAVSCALQETWGIAQQEAAMLGCIPVVPNRLSYTEMYADDFRYTTPAELVSKVRNAAINYTLWQDQGAFKSCKWQIEHKGKQAITNMLNVIRGFEA